MHTGHRYDNFVVGLTNVSPVTSTPTFYHYTLCGQYPGAVPLGTTVSVKCQDNLPPFRYVIVQLPLYDFLVACEIEVLVRGMRMSNINYSDIYHLSRQLFSVVISPRCRRAPSGSNLPHNFALVFPTTLE